MNMQTRPLRARTVSRGAPRAPILRTLARTWRVYLFLLPTFAFLVAFIYYPIFSALFHSLYEWDGVNSSFVGLAHFKQLLTTDTIFLKSVPNVLKLAGARLLIAVTVPLLTAEVMFNLKRRGAAYFWRVLFVVPMVVPWIVMILVWRFIYDPTMGVINSVLRAFSLDSLAQTWLGDSKLALWCIAAYGFPWVAGFNLLIYLAGLDNINEELFDAAAIDGARGLRRVATIDVPLIMGQVKLIVVMTTISQLQTFQDVLLLTNGGPGRATFVPGLVLYRSAFFYNRMGYASAIGVLVFVVILGLTTINMRFLSTATEYEPDH